MHTAKLTVDRKGSNRTETHINLDFCDKRNNIPSFIPWKTLYVVRAEKGIDDVKWLKTKRYHEYSMR